MYNYSKAVLVLISILVATKFAWLSMLLVSNIVKEKKESEKLEKKEKAKEISK